MPRPGCYVCMKAPAECICGLVPRVANRTGVHILQHPRERLHSIGTARIARLGLGRVRLEVAPPGLVATGAFREGLPEGACLLFPGPGSPDLADLAAAEQPRDLVVLDGTWREARALVRENPWLAELPRVRLQPAAPSRYRIRKEPRREYISTIEAIVAALRILEPETTQLDGLIAAFDTMIDRQVEHMRRRQGEEPRLRSRPRPPGAPSAVFTTDSGRLVLVYGELHAYDTPTGCAHDVIHWVAERPHSGETFSRVSIPGGGARPDARQLANMGLSSEQLAGADTQAELARAWDAFRRPEDVVVAWNRSTFTRFLSDSRRLPDQRIHLKAGYCNRHPGAPGHLEELVAELGLPLPDPVAPGRAGRRLACTRAMLEHLRGEVCPRSR